MRKFLAIVCLLGAAFFLLPLALDVCHAGMFAPAIVLVLLAAWLRWGRSWPRWLRRLLAVLYAAGALTAGFLFWQMEAHAAAVPIPENGPYTVVVLGCRADNGKPGVMLRGRVEAAYAYLTAHPESCCVCSGGLDELGEPLTQGEVIAVTLESMGIAPERLLVDSRSENTRENLMCSAELIGENDLSRHVAIASDRFHQYRAACYARQYGLAPAALGCRSPWLLAPGYYCREMLALLADVFFR